MLWTFDDDGAPVYNMALCGGRKRTGKRRTSRLPCIYRFLAWPSAAGNDAFILANDEGQAADDLALVKKAVRPPIRTLARRVNVLTKEIVRKDGRGVLRILPARDIAGAHGKTLHASSASTKSTPTDRTTCSKRWRPTRRGRTC